MINFRFIQSFKREMSVGQISSSSLTNNEFVILVDSANWAENWYLAESNWIAWLTLSLETDYNHFFTDFFESLEALMGIDFDTTKILRLVQIVMSKMILSWVYHQGIAWSSKLKRSELSECYKWAHGRIASVYQIYYHKFNW